MGEKLFADARVRRPVRVVGPDAKEPVGIEMRFVVDKGRPLIYLINMNKARTAVSLKGIERPMRDLITDRPVVCPYEMASLEVLLLEELPANGRPRPSASRSAAETPARRAR